jgi:hypothetical protein
MREVLREWLHCSGIVLWALPRSVGMVAYGGSIRASSAVLHRVPGAFIVVLMAFCQQDLLA